MSKGKGKRKGKGKNQPKRVHVNRHANHSLVGDARSAEQVRSRLTQATESNQMNAYEVPSDSIHTLDHIDRVLGSSSRLGSSRMSRVSEPENDEIELVGLSYLFDRYYFDSLDFEISEIPEIARQIQRRQGDLSVRVNGSMKGIYVDGQEVYVKRSGF